MAKKTAALTNTAGAKTSAPASLAAVDSSAYSGDFTGNFEGKLRGNADTATSLAKSFRINIIGDGSGYAETSGNNTNLSIKVNKAERANTADHATYADNVLLAQNAATASFADRAQKATTANHAGSADSATSAEFAETAASADTALTADNATIADKAIEANHAAKADWAKKSDQAKEAEVAGALTKNAPEVPKAKYAKYAAMAKQAQYDCRGLAIHEFYALKSDLPTDCFTLESAQDVFVPREEQVTQAVVVGKATGHGFLLGNTLKILITSLCCKGNGGENIYADLEFVNKFVEELAETTKVYIDKRGHMFVFNREVNDYGAEGLGHWVEITSSLDKETQEYLDNALARLDDVVTIHGDQTIKDHKVFENTVQAEIADIENDDPRTLVTVHNLRDVIKMIEAHNANGWDWAYIDYTLVSNQDGMVPHKSYWGLLDENKTFLPINPETAAPYDLNAKPSYIRHYRKTSNGIVVFYDLDITDHTLFARLDGATFTGPVRVPGIDLDAEPSDLAINFMDVKHLINDMIEQAQIGRVWKFLGERPKTVEEIPVGQIGLYEMHPKEPEEDAAWTYVGQRPTADMLPSLNPHDILLYDAPPPEVPEKDSAWQYIGKKPESAEGLSVNDILLYDAEGGGSFGSNNILKGRLYLTPPIDLDVDDHEVVLIQHDETLIKD